MALPATQVLALRPPPLPLDYHKLCEEAKHCKVVFRVWEPTSMSPLIWTGNHDNSGFRAPNENLSQISPESYLKVWKSFRGGIEWTEGIYMKQTIVDHILQRDRHTALYYPGMVMDQPGYDIPADEKSPWISTSKNLFWCIWDIARRLALALDPTLKADPDNPHGRPPASSRRDHKVHLTLIRHHSGTIGLSDARRGHLEVHINPRGPVSRIHRDQMSISIQNDFDTARRLAIITDEILYFGRIFAQNIASSLEFTVDHLPIPLPQVFFRQQRRDRPASPASDDSEHVLGWLDDLVWDPHRHGFHTAKEMVERAKRFWNPRTSTFPQ